MVARLTPDQKVGRSNRSGLIWHHGMAESMPQGSLVVKTIRNQCFVDCFSSTLTKYCSKEPYIMKMGPGGILKGNAKQFFARVHSFKVCLFGILKFLDLCRRCARMLVPTQKPDTLFSLFVHEEMYCWWQSFGCIASIAQLVRAWGC